MNFALDPQNLPDSLKSDDAQKAFTTTVLNQVQSSSAGAQESDPLFAAIVGMLVLDGYTDTTSPSFQSGFWAARAEAAGSTLGADRTTQIPNQQVYQQVAQAIASSSDRAVYYQELAQVSRNVIANAGNVPVGSPTFSSQIRVYDDAYIASGPTSQTLDLPDFATGDVGAAADDIRPDNIRAVAVIYAAWQLEQARVFEVVDRIMETWWNGQLPVGISDKGSKLLDTYYWNSEFRLSDAARHMQYGRVLGAPGGEVSTEVQPNTQFSDLWLRFVSSLAEYDRQQRVGDLIGGQRTGTLTLTGEQVRQSGRNLAANASLYGFGGTQFAARRLATLVQTAFAILNAPDIQAAYGVTGPWQVVERVAATELGGTPNIVKYRTMADAGRNLLNLIAKYYLVWSSSGNPLFTDQGSSAGVALQLSQVLVHLATRDAGDGTNGNAPGAGGGGAQQSDITPTDQDDFMRQAGNWLAVNGVKDDQVAQFSQPAETQYAPSIPTIAPQPPAASNGAGQGLDQLRQMVSQGQVPSLDQLKSLVMPGTN